MTQTQDIIQASYRELNLIGIGRSPSTPQTVEALALLNQVFQYVLGGPAGEKLNGWPLGNYGRENIDQIYLTTLQLINPPINSRMFAVQDSALTVYMPVRPSDGSRMGIADPYSRLAALPILLDGNGRTIETAASALLNVNGTFRDWMYRADQGNWVRLNDLIATDQSPFPEEFDSYFSILLALRIAPRAGVKLADTTLAAFKGLETKFIARYLQVAPLIADPSLTWPSVQSYDQFAGWRQGSTTAFDQGWGIWGGGIW